MLRLLIRLLFRGALRNSDSIDKSVKMLPGKMLVCVLPVAIACVIVGWAFYNYNRGEGKPRFQLGVDLVGGTILVYQVDPTKKGADAANLDDLTTALKRRIDPNDLYNVTIRPVPGTPPRVEIILPTGGQGHGEKSLTHAEIEKIRGLIAQQGRLEFRILANTTDESKAIADIEAWMKDKDHKAAIDDANKNGEAPPAPATKYPVTINGEAGTYTYSWTEVGKEELYHMNLNSAAKENPSPSSTWNLVAKARNEGEAIQESLGLIYSREIPEKRRKDLPTKDKDKQYEYFVLTREETDERKVVTGEFLDVGGVKSEPDEKGKISVAFAFNNEGASRFGDLTTLNRPASKEAGSFKRRLAIILDGQIRSAPSLNQPITGGHGIITGEFTAVEIENLIRILRAGALPATLLPNPVAQNSMGATLGEDTIRKGTWSVLIAFAAILIFMAVYYRFAGLVACFALLANLILTVAFMVLVSATFTLPGLAGLVLMLGMAVDANILIYERLREERERGASLALAIRNGYDRAFPTIIDTHLSSMFTAIVLYVVGNDQLKGFGISLFFGLLISLFTSLYITRTIFDIWMGNGWLRDLKMMHLFHRPNFDFMSIRHYWFTATIILTILGGALFIYRLDRGGLNIDFMGGTAYGGRLRDPLSLADLRKKLETSTLPDLSIEQIFIGDNPFNGGEKSRFFNVRTTEKDATKVQMEINKLLGEDLDAVQLNWQTWPSEGEGFAKRAKEWKDENKRGYLLKFTTPDSKGEGFASLYRVRTMVQDEVKRLAQEDESAAKYLSSRNFTLEKDPTAIEKEDHFNQMILVVSADVPESTTKEILDNVRTAYNRTPQPDRLENFDRQLATNTQQRALLAIVLSWGAILLYLWFRFGNWTFGAAAVMCLIHDLFFTLGMIAACHYVHQSVGTLGFLNIQDFKIDLPAVAALLTLVGYSVNDTIVVFDRIREVRGKNPALTPQMINDSVNQTLSRTVLASLATWLVVVVLYFFGGEGVHLFAFVMVVGVIVGTYSSIYIASPLLLIFGEGAASKTPVRERLPEPTETSA